MQLPEHGANPRHVYEKLGMTPPSRIVDFSENCNPAGPTRAVINIWPELASRLHAYPDPSGEPFRSKAAEYHGVGNTSVFVGNGAAEIFSLIAERYRGKRALVIHPTFSEYEATLQAKGVAIERIIASEMDGFRLQVDAILAGIEEASVLYICTPNNPTGVMPEPEELLSIIQRAGETGCEVVIDEAFIDFVDENRSFIPILKDFPHVIVVRSMTKMYSIPGIRLGYAVAHPDVIEELKSTAPHWNVNGMAAAIGAVCLGEEAYREAAIRHAKAEREKMEAFLNEFGCTVTESEANFIVFKPANAGNLYKELLEKGFVLRHSENFKGMDGRWLRVGMKSAAEMEELRRELSVSRYL